MNGLQGATAGGERYQRDNTALRKDCEALRVELVSARADRDEWQLRAIHMAYRLHKLREVVESYERDIHMSRVAYDELIEALNTSAVEIGALPLDGPRAMVTLEFLREASPELVVHRLIEMVEKGAPTIEVER